MSHLHDFRFRSEWSGLTRKMVAYYGDIGVFWGYSRFVLYSSGYNFLLINHVLISKGRQCLRKYARHTYFFFQTWLDFFYGITETQRWQCRFQISSLGDHRTSILAAGCCLENQATNNGVKNSLAWRALNGGKTITMAEESWNQIKAMKAAYATPGAPSLLSDSSTEILDFGGTMSKRRSMRRNTSTISSNQEAKRRLLLPEQSI